MAERADTRSIAEFLRDLKRTRKLLDYNYHKLNSRHSEYFGCVKNLNPQSNIKEFVDDFNKIIENYSHDLNNYLASYVALIDHIITIRDSIKNRGNQEILKTYREKVSKSGLRHEQIFARRLRVYILHYRIPSIDIGRTGFGYQKNSSGVYEIAGIDLESSLALNKAELLKWNGWSAGRDYLIKISTLATRGRINLGGLQNDSGLIYDLNKSVLEFLDWFVKEIGKEL